MTSLRRITPNLSFLSDGAIHDTLGPVHDDSSWKFGRSRHPSRQQEQEVADELLHQASGGGG